MDIYQVTVTPFGRGFFPLPFLRTKKEEKDGNKEEKDAV